MMNQQNNNSMMQQQQQQQMMQMNQGQNKNAMNNNNMNKVIPQEISREDMGDFIYNYCENLYKELAPKITGMIMELPEENLRYFTAKENITHLEELIKNAYTQCTDSGVN